MLEKIRQSCWDVLENSKYVSINYDKLDEHIKKVNCDNLKHWLSTNPYNMFDLGIEKLVNFMLLIDAINYSFWGSPKWTIETVDGLKDGTDALMYAMLEYVRSSNNFDFTKVSMEEFRKILKGNVEIPLIEERYNTLVEISRVVNEKMGGNFYKYIYDIKDDISLFELIIDNFASFEDFRTYNGQKVYFYKLAQLLVSDILNLREKFEGVGVDYSNLVGCADYKIPQTLRALGILEYEKSLADLVDRKVEIESNSVYEVEIRAGMLAVIDYISKKILDAKSVDINDYFFVLAREVKGIAKPYHLCRNTNY